VKTGEYLRGGKPPKGEGRPVKAPKRGKRPPSGSKTPVTPLPGPGKKRPAKPGKGPKAHIRPRPAKPGKGPKAPYGSVEDLKDKRGGKPKPKPKGLTVTKSAAVKSVAAASAAAKTGKRRPAPGQRKFVRYELPYAKSFSKKKK
jgi:hypothetical protein